MSHLQNAWGVWGMRATSGFPQVDRGQLAGWGGTPAVIPPEAPTASTPRPHPCAASYSLPGGTPAGWEPSLHPIETCLPWFCSFQGPAVTPRSKATPAGRAFCSEGGVPCLCCPMRCPWPPGAAEHLQCGSCHREVHFKSYLTSR